MQISSAAELERMESSRGC